MLCLKKLVICAIALSSITDAVQAKYIHKPDMTRWIKQQKISATWEEARQQCENEGATLASPIDEELLKYMQSFVNINNHTTAVFIGTRARRDPEQEYKFTSIEGISLDDMPEAVLDMIEKLEPQDGDCLSMDPHGIRAVSCWIRLPYMCYKYHNTINKEPTEQVPQEPTEQVPQEPTECGSDYKYLESGSCYKLHNNLVTWHEGLMTCTQEGAYLTVINNEAEAKLVHNFVGQMFWIGLRDLSGNNTWMSIKGDSLDQIYHDWHDGHIPMENSVYCTIDSDGKIEDYPIEYKFPFVCEKEVKI